MQKRIKAMSKKSLRMGLFILLMISSQILGQTFVTTGGTVTSGYWNEGNTGSTSSFVVPNDGTVAFVSLQIEVNDDGTYTQIGDVEAASAQQSKVLTRSATQLETAGSFNDGDSFDIVAVFITGGLLSVDTTTLATGVIVDQTAPGAFQVGSVITSGGNVSAGYWNGTNTNLAVTVPIANDASLQNGSLQLTGFVGGNPAEVLGASASVLIISTNQTITLDDTDFINKVWFLDSQTFSITATLSDAAGNSTDGTASVTTLSIDQTAPNISSVVSSTANGTYGVGATIAVTVNFNESVTLTGGDLLTNLNAGAQLTTGAFASTTYSENYTISEGDDAPSLNVSSFALSGGSAKIVDAAGNNADLATITSNLEDNTDLVVDGSTPSVSSITSTETLESFGVGDEINVTLNFSEALTLSGGNLLVTLETGASDQVVTISSISSSTSASGTYTVQSGDESSDLAVKSLSLSAGTLVDGGGNSVDLTLPVANNLSDNKNIAVDGAGPAAFTVSTATVTGGNVVNGFWNGTNTGMDVIVPIANDASLEGGTVQIRGFFGDISGAENLGAASDLLGAHLGNNITVSLSSADIEGMVGYGAAQTIKLSAILADAGGNSTTGTQSASTFVIDEDEPTISAITSTTADGTYGIGDDVNVTITFSNNVTISGGNLLTDLNSSAQLSTSSISDVNTLSQTYTISALNETSDLDVSSLSLSGGSVSLTDAAGNSADLSLPVGVSSLAGSSALEVDGIVPTITSITSSSTDGSYGVDDVINVSVTFSENMTLTGGNLLVTLETGDPDRQVTISSMTDAVGSGTYTVQSGDASDDLTASALSLSAGTLRDAGGNDVTLTDLTGVTNIDDGSDLAVDGASPAAFIVGTITVTGGDVVSNYWNDTNSGMTVTVPIAADNSLTGGNVQLQAFFNDISGAVDVGSAVTITGGHLGGNLILTLTEANVEDIPGYDEDVVLKLTAVMTDDGGNATTGTQSANEFTIDTTAPTVSAISSTTSNGTYGVSDDVNVTLTFDENVTLAGGNLLTTLNTSTELSAGTIANTSSLSQTYTIAEGEESTDFTVTGLALSVGTATLVDAAGNETVLTLPVANNIADNSAIVIDGILPTLSSISSTTTSASYGVGDPVNITLSFSEAVTLSGGNLNVTHDASATTVAISSITTNEASQTYTIASGDASNDFTISDLSLAIGASLQDAGGNDVDLSDISGLTNIDDTRDIIIDGDSPAAFQVGSVITVGGRVIPGYWNNSPNTSVNVTILIADDASLQNGSVQLQVQVGSGSFEDIGNPSTILVVNANKTITLSSTNITDITGYAEDVVLSFRAIITDAVGNSTTGTTSETTITVDTTDPTIESILSNPATDEVEIGDSADITVTFSEAVTLEGGNLITTLETGDSDAELTTAVIANALSFTETYTVSEGESSGNLTVGLMGIDAGTLTDAAGNDASFALPGAANLNGGTLVIDGVYPTIVSISSTSDDNIDYSFGDEISATIEFSEALTLSGANLIITLETGPTDRDIVISSINNSTTATGTYTIASGDQSSDLTVNSVTYPGATLIDAAGNDLDETLPTGPNSLSGAYDFVVDGSVPIDFTVGSVITAGGTVKAGYWNRLNSDVLITVPIDNDASLQGGTLQILARSGANAFANLGASIAIPTIGVPQTVIITSADIVLIDGFTEGSTLEFSAIITDIVSNSTTGTASATSLFVDRVDPTITGVTSSPADASLSIDQFADITINFSEAVTLSGDDLITTLETGTTDAELTTTAFASLDEITERYTVVLDETSLDLDVTSFDYGIGVMQDAAGNNIDLSLPAGENLADNSALVIDGSIPTVVSISSTSLPDIMGLGETVEIDIEFSEAIILVGDLVLTTDTGYDITIGSLNVGNTTATGTYLVEVGVESSDLTIATITTTGTLRDGADNDLDRSLPLGSNLSDNNALEVDGVVPDAFTTGTILTIGAPVVTDYWNEDNTGLQVILPIPGDDASLDGGSAQLEARVGANAFVAVGDPQTPGIIDLTMTLSAAQLETELPGFAEGEVIQIQGVFTDNAGNSTTGSISATSLTIDQIDPSVTTTGDIVVAGGIEKQGYWNSTNETLTVSTDLDADNSLIDSTLQMQMRIGVGGTFINIGSAEVIDLVNTTYESVVLAADLSSALISDGDELFFRAVLTDIAGNKTEGLPGANSIIVDTSFPAAFTVGTVTATNGSIVPNYYNASNAGATITVPITSDNTLIGGEVELRVRINGGAAANLAGPDEILSDNTSYTFTLSDADLIAVYSEGDILTFDAIITDASGNATTGSVSLDQLEIDETLPIANDFTDVTTTGDINVVGYWNSSNTGIDIVVPLTNDNSLPGGTLQISGDLVFGDLSFETFAASYTFVSPTGSAPIFIPAAQIEALAGGDGFVDGLTIELRAIVTDVAGNQTTSNTSAVTFEIDQTLPTIPLVTDMVILGSRVIDGIWNSTADSLLAVIPVDLLDDPSLDGGFMQVHMSAGASFTENDYVIIRYPSLSIPGQDTIRFHRDDITAIDPFLDLDTLYTRIFAQDRAGNELLGNISLQKVLIDINPPDPFDCGPLTATNGVVIENAYNLSNAGLSLEIPIDNDPSLEDGELILKIGVEAPFVGAPISVTYLDVDSVAITNGDLGNTITMSLTGPEVEALVNYGTANVIHASASLRDYAGNERVGTESADTLVIDLVSPDIPVILDTVTVGPDVVEAYWNGTNTGIDFLFETLADPGNDPTLIDGYFQVQGRIGVIETFSDIGTPVNITNPNLTELSLSLIANDIEVLPGFGENLGLDLRVILTDGSGNSTIGDTLDDWLLTDQVAPTSVGFYAAGTTLEPYINAEDNLRALWAPFNDASSGVAGHEYSIGTDQGESNFLDWVYLESSTEFNTHMTYIHADSLYINVRAVDLAGNISDTLSTSAIVVDLVLPTSTSNADPYYLIDNWEDVNSFGGTYSDELSHVDTLWLDLSRESDNFYWDGSDWVADSTALEMSIDGVDGIWNYSISSDTLSNHENYFMRLLAIDSSGNRQESAILDTFQFIINSAPDVLSFAADTTTLEDSLFTYLYQQIDPDFETSRGDSLTYTLSTGTPAGMTVDSTGLLSWTPVDSAVGEHIFAIIVTDLLGLQDSVLNTLTVLNVNDAPEPVTLILPLDETQLVPEDSLLLTFNWTAAFDIEDNPVTYEITMQGEDYEATMTTADTFLTVDISEMDYPTTPMEWFVHALDAEDVSEPSAVFEFTTSAASALLNTNTIAIEMRRDRNLDSLFIIKNMGLTDLRWSLADGPSWLTLPSESGIVEYQDSSLVVFNINPSDSTVGRFGDTLRLATNDPLQDTIAIALNVAVFDIPTPVLAFYKNPAYSGFYEMMIVDSLGMVDTLILTYGEEQLEIDTIGTYSYVATVEISKEGQNSFELYASNWIGDTTITANISVSLARQGEAWSAQSPDKAFEVQGSSGSVNHNSHLTILDTVLSQADDARYKVLSDAVMLADPVLVSMPADEDNQAIYIRDEGGEYIELPTVRDGNRIHAWAERLGAFNFGPQTIIVPERSKLSQNYPNPFNPSTTIDYDIGFLDGLNQNVEFSIYNIRGQEVRKLVNTQAQPGQYSITWNGLNEEGMQVSSGIYFARLMTGKGYVRTVKMLVLR